jgi:hypothetical protein
MNLHAIGIDLGKTAFHLVGLNQAGEVQVRKKFSRTQHSCHRECTSSPQWDGSLCGLSFPRQGSARAGP